jgi:cytochrome oxidase Cu insertion factor (SCO1/SenC/PrrC family)
MLALLTLAALVVCGGCELDNPFNSDSPENETTVYNEGGTVIVQDGEGNTVEVANIEEAEEEE